jgi:YidC/Oxa1 family membrane protein insertase
MLQKLWQTVLIQPLLNGLLLLNYAFGNFGLAIIGLTIIVKTILVPFNIPQLKMQTKRKVLQEELDKLKEKHKDKQELSKAQMELYKKHGINPASGCLPMIVQVLIFFALYRVFIDFLNNGLDTNLLYFPWLADVPVNFNFLWLDLHLPDPYYILPALAALFQFLLSKSFMPAAKDQKQVAKKTEPKSDDMMANMQQQMLYVAPIMTLIIGARLPSGLVLYWFVSTLYSYVQNILLKRYILKD